MSLFNVFSIAGSGMTAQMIRLNVTASNIANANSVGQSPEATYKAKQPIFAAAYEAAFGGSDVGAGVKVTDIKQSQIALKKRHQPDHPLANEQGFIYLSNVNTMEEMASMISASRNYQTNVEIANTAKQMMLKTLALGR